MAINNTMVQTYRSKIFEATESTEKMVRNIGKLLMPVEIRKTSNGQKNRKTANAG